MFRFESPQSDDSYPIAQSCSVQKHFFPLPLHPLKGRKGRKCYQSWRNYKRLRLENDLQKKNKNITNPWRKYRKLKIFNVELKRLFSHVSPSAPLPPIHHSHHRYHPGKTIVLNNNKGNNSKCKMSAKKLIQLIEIT